MDRIITLNDTLKGIFIEEVKNRFLCKVNINGNVEECYVPSSARLSNFFDLENVPVLVVENQGKKTRTKYKLFAIWQREQWVLVCLSYLNNLMRNHLLNLHNVRNEQVLFEKTIDNKYKADILLEDDISTIYEIKGVLSNKEKVIFPSVCGERAIEQLRFFRTILRKKGYCVKYCIVLLNNDIHEVKLNRNEKNYLRCIKSCMKYGMEIEFFRVCWSDETPQLIRDKSIQLQ